MSVVDDASVEEEESDAEEGEEGDTGDADMEEEGGELTVRVVGATTVRMGPGLHVLAVAPSAAGCSTRVAINGLDARVPDEGLRGALLACGPLRAFVRPHPTYAIATFLEPASAEACIARFDGRDFAAAAAGPPAAEAGGGGPVSLRRTLSSSSGGGGGPSPLTPGVITARAVPEPGSITPVEAATLKLAWYPASRPCWLHYTSAPDASAAASRLDGKTLPGGGAVIGARASAPKPGDTVFSVTLSGVDEATTSGDLAAWVHRVSDVATSKVVLGAVSFSNGRAAVELLLASAAPEYVRGSLTVLPAPRPARKLAAATGAAGTTPKTVKVKALARFSTADAAVRAQRSLTGVKQPTLGGQRLHAQQVASAKFKVLNGAYAVLRPRIDAVLAAGGPGLRGVAHPGPRTTVVKIRGDSAVGVATTKRLLDGIVAGERLVEVVGGVRNVPVWCEGFRGRGGAALDAAVAAVGVFIQRSSRDTSLRAYGEPGAVAAARAVACRLVAAYRASHHIVPVRTAAARRRLAVRGLPGMPGAVFDAGRRAVLVTGDAAAAAAAAAAVAALEGGAEAGAAAAAECPTCFCELGAGHVRLQACGHAYCRECFDGWLAQGEFPLACFVEGCGAPLALRQLREVLGDRFRPLVRAALDAHVAAHPEALRFCITPDCPQMYATDGDRVVRCGSCAVTLCTRCHVEEHAGVSCDAHAAAERPPDAVRARIIEECLTTHYPTAEAERQRLQVRKRARPAAAAPPTTAAAWMTVVVVVAGR